MGVVLYDILLDGFHTPLTREEISELYHAGRLTPHDPCKHAAKNEWRTVDEHFPLLKHSAPTLPLEEAPSVTGSRWLIAAILAAAIGVFSVIFFSTTGGNHRTAVATGASSGRSRASSTLSSPPSLYSMQTAPSPSRALSKPLTSIPLLIPQTTPSIPRPNTTATEAEYARIEREQKRLDQERRAREQSQRAQTALAERLRAENDARQSQAERAAGRDIIFELDRNGVVDVGGSAVTLRVHDNDVTSIDYWVNGAWYRDVKKQKGITGSGTDETLIYTNTRASLYYVWELSGALNHCRLRVRQN
jgi:hypothetical protein